MMTKDFKITGVERSFDKEEIIVSKTDINGYITYCNDVFLRITGYLESECLGRPHRIVRHPHMPGCIFRLLWETIQDGREIFTYIVNLSKNGDHYWVNAHITPSRDKAGRIVGYHSNRRVPDRKILQGAIIPLYKDLLAEEQRHVNREDGIKASFGIVKKMLGSKNMQYGEFIARLTVS